ncbi:MAG: periplasmic heavy metal sensor [Nitrospiraceae bacterium]|nr:periplasmic heavy metal sensor [Nitrospiraceae bacterium]
MKKLLMAMFAVVLVMGLAATSGAMTKKGMRGMGMGQGMGMGMGMGMGNCGCGEKMMMDRLASLGLDAKQKESVKAIHLKTKKEMIRKKADADIARLDLREILGKDTVDMAAAEATVKQIEALRADMQMMHIRAREEIKAVLTPAQRTKFAEMRDMDGMGGCMCGDMGGKSGMGMKKKCRSCSMKGKGMRGMDEDMKPGPGMQHKN